MTANVRTLHFIRHGQSTYNVAVHETSCNSKTNLNSPSFVDAPLSAKGIQQALQLKHRINELKPDSAITSPYRRTLDTCLAACENVNIEIFVTPLCGECMDSICDIGSPPQKLEEVYADKSISFSNLREVWWYKSKHFENCNNTSAFIEDFINSGGEKVRETRAELYKRADKFYNYLLAQKEQCIVIFSHHSFLRNFLHWFFDRNLESRIQNCEILSYNLPSSTG